MRKRYVSILTVLFCAVACTFTAFGCGEESGASVNGTYYLYENEQYDRDSFVTLDGSTWKDDSDESGECKISGESITLYVEIMGEKEEFASGTVKNGVLTLKIMGTNIVYCKEGFSPSGGGNPSDTQKYTVTYDANGGSFSGGSGTLEQKNLASDSLLTAPASPERTGWQFGGWASNKSGSDMWKFATDKVTKNVTLYAVWMQESAAILSVDGANIDGTDIFMLVDSDVDSVSLSNKVVCSADSVWRLYYDKLGQTEIPTKIAAGKLGALADGGNVFYIVVTSSNGSQVNVYELTVHRSYSVEVSYYDESELLKSVSVDTGNRFTAAYTPDIEGYTFHGWKTSSGSSFTEEVLYAPLSLYADKTANRYTVSLDANGGNAPEELEKEIVFDGNFSLAVPSRTGYSFKGWYVGAVRITDEEGESVAVWQFAEDRTVAAKWEANIYTVSLNQNNASAGTLSGAGDFAYDGNVTVNAATNEGYTWLGWYDSADRLVSEEESFTFQMGFDVTYTAKWTYFTVTAEKNIDSAGSITSFHNQKVSVGKAVKLTASTYKGYNFLGWYDGDTLLTEESTYSFTMVNQDVSLTAKWDYYTVTTTNAMTEAGKITMYTGQKISIGQDVELTATVNSGYHFVGWYDGDTLLTSDFTYTFRMEKKNVTYTAKWDFYTVTTVKTLDSAGSITSYTDKKISLGSSVTLSATTYSGYTWVGWYDGETLLTGELNYTFTMEKKNVRFTAKWIACPITIESQDSSKGTVSGMPSTSQVGQKIRVTANTKSGNTFVGWFTGETLLSGELSYSFTMTEEKKTYTAKWIACPVTIDWQDSTKGTVSGMPSTSQIGQKITIKAATKNGNTFLGWYDGDTLLTGELSYTFTMTEEKRIYTAKWIACPLSVISQDSSKGTVSGKPLISQIGQEITVTASPCLGYDVKWYEGETLLSDDLTYTFTLTADRRILTARFETKKEMSNFIFTSTKTDCSITAINDKTVTEIIVPDYVTQLGLGVFSGCSNLVTISLPFIGEKIKPITQDKDIYYTFGYVFGTYNYAGSTATVQSYGYYENGGLVGGHSTTYYIPATLENVRLTGGNYGFGSYERNSVISNAFENCVGLKSIILSDSLTEIYDDAFSGCSGLTSITLSKNLRYIRKNAFSYCGQLTDVLIPESVIQIGNDAFRGCDSLKYNEWNGAKYLGSEQNKYRILIEAKDTSLTSLTIHDGTTMIYQFAFQSCRGLKEVTIPDSVTYIGEYAFRSCPNLTSFRYGGKIEEWKAIEKGFYWDSSTGNYIVTCSDGTLTKAES